MTTDKVLTADELKVRAIKFFDQYGEDLQQIRQLLSIRLNQLALAYTIQNNLPPEAVVISTRVKTVRSFLKKLEMKNWPQFYFPTDVVQDLVGARITCWFVDDCEGMKDLISASKHLTLTGKVKDYIKEPKPSGYRAIHMLTNVGYDAVSRLDGKAQITNESMICEIQIRTKLQDSWGSVTHDFSYKAKNYGVEHALYERILAEIAGRLANEDSSLLTLRNAYQALVEQKQGKKARIGFSSSSSSKKEDSE
jgi:putative GTP pyrophosphokinase